MRPSRWLPSWHLSISQSAALRMLLGVLAFLDRAAFHEQGHAGQSGHGDAVGIVAGVGAPVALVALLLGEPLQPLVDRLAVFFGDFVGMGCRAGPR